MNYTIAQSDPFAPYEAAGKKKGPKVPEASTYGLIFMALVITVAIWARRRK